MLVTPLKCDGDGNVYLRNDIDSESGIQKLNEKGKQVATFRAAASTDLGELPEIDATGDFSVAEDGQVYVLVHTHSRERYVFVYAKDGTYKSKIRLDPGPVWQPKFLSVFPSGNLLVVGEKWQRATQDYAPFSGIFSSDGTLLKELTLEDDEAIYKYTTSGDPKFMEHPGNNKAIGKGGMAAASDGNIYIMRWLSPAVIYAVSPGGETIRRFTVDPGDAGLMPSGMYIAGNRLALEFHDSNIRDKKVIEVVDLEGKKIATYSYPSIDGKPFAFLTICYSENPERFTFLQFLDENQSALSTAEP